MKRKYLKIKSNEEVIIVCNNKPNILIKNENNHLNISECGTRSKLESTEIINITDIEYNKLVDFILTKLMESNNNDKTDILINKKLEEYFKLLCGNNYKDQDIQNMKFQCITFYDCTK